MGWEDLEKQAEDMMQSDRLHTEVEKLSRELDRVKHQHADYLDKVYEAVEGSIAKMKIRPVRPPAKRSSKRTGGVEVALPFVSDTQIGKRTPTYNTQVAQQRLQLYARKTLEITEVQRADHPVDQCVIPMLGDMVEGVDIFPGQQWRIDSTLYDQVFNTVDMVIEFSRTLLAEFDTVTIEAVDGNHGRIGRKGQFGPMDNSDRMIYEIVRRMMRDEPRFTLNMTDPVGERNWYRIIQIGKYKALLIHGDQIRGHSGFPWYGVGKKVQGWGSGGLGEDSNFLDVFMGHYHQIGRIPLNHMSVWANGSTESSNTFAAENLAAQSEPAQWLLFASPDRGRITASYGVELSG